MRANRMAVDTEPITYCVCCIRMTSLSASYHLEEHASAWRKGTPFPACARLLASLLLPLKTSSRNPVNCNSNSGQMSSLDSCSGRHTMQCSAPSVERCTPLQLNVMCCAMLCCYVLCYAMLCYAVLGCAGALTSLSVCCI